MIKAQKELDEVKNMMRTNINTLLERDKTLNEIGDMAGKLKQDSAKFALKAKKLHYSMWLRKYGVGIGLACFIVLGLYYKFS